MKYLEFNRGKQEASKVALEGQGSPIVDLVKEIIKINRLTGMGITELSLPNNSNGTGTYIVEVQNPIVKKTEGAAGMFLISYWAGALSSLIGKQLEIKTINYDKSRDVMVGELATRIIVPEIDT
jgi:arabinogalactan endo-1,4-beta-galactosidase